jgi:hypothetical protein
MRSTALRLAVTGALSVALAGCVSGAALVGVHDAPSQVSTTAPVAPQTAEAIATRVLAQADEAAAAQPAQANQLRARALTGAALAVADAASRLGAGTPPATAPLTRTEAPKVLAISRGTAWPRAILVQTSTQDGAAVLNLLTSPDAQTPFRLSAAARMHPGASVAALDPLGQGSRLVTDESKVAVAPNALLEEYAASLAFPKPAAAKDVDTGDPFSVAVRANAAAQAKSFGKLATLTQRHVVQPQDTVAIELRDGGALVFALMERTDTITRRPGAKPLVPTNPDFKRLVPKKEITTSAELKSYETVVFTVPAQGRASVVAADEVLFSAKGA